MKSNIDQVHTMVDEWCESPNAQDFKALSDLPLAMLRQELHGGVDRSLSDELLDEATLGVDSVKERFALVGVPSPQKMGQAGPLFDRYMERGFFHKMWGGFEHSRNLSFQSDGGLEQPGEWQFVLAENNGGEGHFLGSALIARDNKIERSWDPLKDYEQYLQMLPEGIEVMSFHSYIALMRARFHKGLDHNQLDRGFVPSRTNDVGVVRGSDEVPYGVQTRVDSIGGIFVPSRATTTVKRLADARLDRMPRYRAQVPFADVNLNSF